MERKYKLFKLICWNYALIITILITIEILGHLTYKIYKGRYIFQINDSKENLFREHPYLSGSLKKDHFLLKNDNSRKITTNKYGYRITEAEALDFPRKTTIVCLGGSTTFGTRVTDEDSWPFMLQSKLGKDYKVYNLGVPGYSTLESLIQLLTFVPELKPDIVINYQGWNDIRNYHLKSNYPDYYAHGISQKTALKINKPKLKDYSFIIYLTKKLSRKIIKRKKHNITVETPGSDSKIDSIYARNLKTIQLLANNLNAKQIYIPQVLNLDFFKNSEKNIGRPWTPTIRDTEMPFLIKNFNSIMSKSIKTNDSTCLIIENILDGYDWKLNHFVDDGHFSKKGNEVFSNIVYDAVKKIDIKKDSISLK